MDSGTHEADAVKSIRHFLIGILMLAGTPVLPLSTVTWTLPQPTPAPAPGPAPRPSTPSQATAVVYVYEKDESAIPTGVAAGINKLNREKRVRATLFERDTVDGSGQTPEQYKPALEAAKRETLPALVVLSGTAVVRVVKAPTTESEVIGAVP